MLNEEDYTTLKNSFVESQILFDKLNRVADQASALDYDESGLYTEDEDIYKRHWLKLSSKIIDSLSLCLESHAVELLKNNSLEMRELSINLIKEEESSKIVIDYSENGAISISQIS